MSVTLLGLPTDANSSFARGAAKAPRQIRSVMWTAAGNTYTERGVNLAEPGVVFEAGDVNLSEDRDERDAIDAAVSAQLDAGRRVVSLGGDHAVTFPIVRAVTRRFSPITVVHFDAHPDLYDSFEGNRYSHACPFARILEEAQARLIQIGIRTMTPPQRALAERHEVSVFAPWQLAEARAALPDGFVYVTVDLDALDPAFAPGVSHREPGGLTIRDVLDTIAAIPGIVVGADVVELNPDRDVDGLTAGAAAKLARELIGRVHTDAGRNAQQL